MRVAAALLLAFALCGCAAERWPGNGDERSASDYPVIEQRWNAASKKTMGTELDMVQIRQAVRRAHPEMTVREVRWLSPSEVMVYTDYNTGETFGYASFYCALEKRDGRWQFAASYLYLIS